MKMKTWWLAGVMAGCALALAGCAKQGDESDVKTLVMVPKGVHPYYEPCYEGFRAAAARYGVKAEYRAAKQFEVPQQVEIIENLLARRVDGIAVSALDDEGLVSVIQQAVDAGITVITFDAPAPSSAALCYIGTMNDTAGYRGGVELAGLMKTAGKVAVLQGGLGAPNLNDRFKGFERALKEHLPGAEIVAREDTQGKIEMVVNKTEAILQAHPDLKAIFCVSAEGIPGVAPVLEEQRKAGSILLAGFDDLPDALNAIRNDTAAFCIAQKTFKMGWLSVENLLAAMDGKPIPKEIDTGVLIVRKDNVDTYMADMKEEFESAAAQPPEGK